MTHIVKKRTNMKQLCRFILYIGYGVIITACALSKPNEPNYQIIHEPALHSEMRSMGESLAVLAAQYQDVDNKVDDSQLYNIVHTELNKIERTASRLGGEDTITNYSVINRYMGAFLYDVRLAREFAERDPPNFLPAFRLVHSCQSCHGSM